MGGVFAMAKVGGIVSRTKRCRHGSRDRYRKIACKNMQLLNQTHENHCVASNGLYAFVGHFAISN